MARWIVLTADRAPLTAHEIIGLTEWDGYVAAADEVIYTDPVDADGDRVDAAWKVSGSVTLAGGVYTYADPGTEPTVADRQRRQIHAAYLWWRINGRTSHWAGLRNEVRDVDGNLDPVETDAPLIATDHWAYHILALIDQLVNGAFAASRTDQQKQELVDHADEILRTLGPTWYSVQISSSGDRATQEAVRYRTLAPVAAGSVIYTDICSTAGVPRSVDGLYAGMPVVIRAGFNPELATLGN